MPHPVPAAAVRSAGELAPQLAFPWVIRLRYGIAAGQVALLLLAAMVLRMDLPVLRLMIPALVVTLTNVFVHVRLGNQPVTDPRHWLGALFVLDTVCLTATLALSGGPMNPFSLFYLVQITLSAVILHRAWTWVLGGLSTMCFGFLFWSAGPLSELQTRHHRMDVTLHLVGMWVAFAIGALFITVFIGKVSEAMRRKEQEILHLQEQLAKNQRIASLAELAAGAAHELATPLGTIAIVSKELQHYAGEVIAEANVAEDAGLIRSEVERCRKILQRMSARGAEPVGESPAWVEPRRLLEMAAETLPEEQRDGFTISAGEPGLVRLPPEATVQALAVLLKNAREAGPPGQPVRLSAGRTGGEISFTIADHGSGMSAEVLSRIGEPFFSTKEPGRGMGLGVFLVRNFADRLGGRLDFTSTPGAGTTAVLSLPTHLAMADHVTV